ncbi:MAG TPA: hypothetical protein VIV40_32000 [Kofleriaceae bacterium]
MRLEGLAALMLLFACADARMGLPNDAQGKRDAGVDVGNPTPEECATDQLATNVSASGQLTCTGLDALSRQAIGDHCSVYLGWRDSCDACATPPAKWGRAATGSCGPGVGTNNTCTMPTLDGVAVHMFGLDLDGDMDGNDKLYTGMHCTAESSTDGVVPCPAGQLVHGFNGTAWTCTSFAKTAIDYVQTNCSIYLGWQDGCDGCTSPPVKWGRTSEVACANGVGVDNTCIAPTPLGTETVRLFGLNTDGDVDGNDKFHVGLRCEPAGVPSTTQTTVCPAGQFVAAKLPDGSFRCESAAPSIERYFADHCTLYFGWHDNCDGCVLPPTKWGKVRVGACANGVGTDDTCSKLTLGQSVDMFGLSPDGNVDDNDVLYVGFRCD